MNYSGWAVWGCLLGCGMTSIGSQILSVHPSEGLRCPE